ncbi:MAG: alpha/beta fold hydrolase [Acidobacteriota bacterium]
MPYCHCDDIDLYYETESDGEPLLLISGLGGGTWSWYGQIPYFRDRYRVVTFDNRGAGRSGMPEGPYSIKGMAADALCLLDHLKLDRVYLFALSMGGMIAQELALLAPGRIRAMALGCTDCGGPSRIPPESSVYASLMNNEGLNREAVVRKNLPLFFSKPFLESRPDAIDAYCSAQIQGNPQPEHAFKAQMAAIVAFDCCSRLPGLRTPTLIVAGGCDVLIPPQNARLIAGLIPGAELVEIPDAGHALHAECRDVLNETAHEFFSRHRGTGHGGSTPKEISSRHRIVY